MAIKKRKEVASRVKSPLQTSKKAKIEVGTAADGYHELYASKIVTNAAVTRAQEQGASQDFSVPAAVSLKVPAMPLFPDDATSEAARQQLLDAHRLFLANKHKRYHFFELDLAASLDPPALVGRQLRVHWPQDEAWYLGTAVNYDPVTGQHKVDYADGDIEWLHVGLERVRLMLHAGEVLPPPSPASLRAIAAHLEAAAKRAEAQQQQQQRQEGSGGVGGGVGSNAAASGDGKATDPRRCRERSAQLLALAEAAQKLPCAATDAGCKMPAHHWLAQQQQRKQQQQQRRQQHVGGVEGGQQQGVAGGGGKGGKGGQQQQQQQQRWCLPGDVVWARVKGSPHWPALVTTREEAEDAQAVRARADDVPVRFFGTYDLCFLPPAVLEEWATGLSAGLHLVPPKWASKFLPALYEARLYMKDGVLAAGMLVGDEDEGEDEQQQGGSGGGGGTSIGSDKKWKRGGSKQEGGKAAAEQGWVGQEEEEEEWQQQVGGAQQQNGGGAAWQPLQISGKLKLLSPGRIEWLHPAFHTERWIYPVGYSVVRTMASPATGGREAPHKCDILMDVRRGPVFRISPEGGRPVEAPSINRAVALLQGEAAPAAAAATAAATTATNGGSRGVAAAATAATAANGHAVFGLSNLKVQRLLQRLPGAGQCDRFAAWIGTPPPREQLDANLSRAKLAASALMQRLPPGVKPVALPREAFEGRCHVCGEDNEYDGNHLVQCDRCRYFAHMDCYGAPRPDGRMWLCDTCRLGGGASPPPCCLCPVAGGLMKPTPCGRWAHAACALWIPETCLSPYEDTSGGGSGKVKPATAEAAAAAAAAEASAGQLLVQGVGRVPTARQRLLCTICQQAHGACIQCAGSRSCCTAFHPLCARGAGYAVEWVQEDYYLTDSDDESDADEDGEREALGGGCMDEGGGEKKRRQRKPRGGKAGGKGGGKPVMLLSPGKRAGLSRAVSRGAGGTPAAAGRSGVDGGNGGGPAAAAGGFKEGTEACDGIRIMCYCRRHTPKQPAAAAVTTTAAAAVPPAAPPADSTSADGAAGADLQAQLGQQGQDAGPVPMGCARALPLHEAIQRSQRQQQQARQQPQQDAGDSGSAAIMGRGYSVPYLVSGRRRVLHMELMPHSAARPPPGTLPPQPKVLSVSDRYRAMVASLRRRVTFGQSAIHGLGLFVKTTHRTGDMIIEYVGERIRSSVADMRERLQYNDVVGAGTYVFGLGDHDCVDATRRGGLAHLINHSCEPNCYSRTITVSRPGGAWTDHVLICARRDIGPGEELNYDYRFRSTELLRCNCGARNCRGTVNCPDEGEFLEDSLWVPRADLQPWNRPQQQQAHVSGVPQQQQQAHVSGAPQQQQQAHVSGVPQQQQQQQQALVCVRPMGRRVQPPRGTATQATPKQLQQHVVPDPALVAAGMDDRDMEDGSPAPSAQQQREGKQQEGQQRKAGKAQRQQQQQARVCARPMDRRVQPARGTAAHGAPQQLQQQALEPALVAAGGVVDGSPAPSAQQQQEGEHRKAGKAGQQQQQRRRQHQQEGPRQALKEDNRGGASAPSTAAVAAAVVTAALPAAVRNPKGQPPGSTKAGKAAGGKAQAGRRGAVRGG